MGRQLTTTPTAPTKAADEELKILTNLLEHISDEALTKGKKRVIEDLSSLIEKAEKCARIVQIYVEEQRKRTKAKTKVAHKT